MEMILSSLSVLLSCHFTFQPQFSSVLCSPLLCHASWSAVRSYSMGGWRRCCVCLVQTLAAKRSHGHRTGEVFTGIFNIKTQINDTNRQAFITIKVGDHERPH